VTIDAQKQALADEKSCWHADTTSLSASSRSPPGKDTRNSTSKPNLPVSSRPIPTSGGNKPGAARAPVAVPSSIEYCPGEEEAFEWRTMWMMYMPSRA
jgi:hypothetical protein